MTKPRAVLGIDPGKTGAVCAMHADGPDVRRFPEDGDPLETMAELMSEYYIAHAYLERVSAMPGNGAVSMFNFGRGYGLIQGWLRGLLIPFTLVSPRVWQKELHLGCSGADAKARSAQAAKQLFPAAELVLPRCRKPHDGMVDALLIAEWGRRNTK